MNFIEHIKISMLESFPTLFEGEITFKEQKACNGVILSMGVAVVVGVTGSKKGRVLVDMEQQTAKKLGEVLAPGLDDEDFPLYAAAELCNIVAGGATTNMNNQNRELGLRLAPPSIFSGIQSKIYSPNLSTQVLSFDTTYGLINLNVGLAGE